MQIKLLDILNELEVNNPNKAFTAELDDEDEGVKFMTLSTKFDKKFSYYGSIGKNEINISLLLEEDEEKQLNYLIKYCNKYKVKFSKGTTDSYGNTNVLIPIKNIEFI